MMMKPIFPIVLLAIFVSACAATVPTPVLTPAASVLPTATPRAAAPTSAPLATQAPVGPTRPSIAVVNLQQARQPDGSVKTTAQVNAQDNLGVGEMNLASPDTMVMGETRTIRLRMSPAGQLASTTPVASPGKTPDLPQFVYKFGGNIQLYAVMIAELRTLSFDVDKPGPIRRDLSPTVPATWDWIVSPRSPGRQQLAIEISVPAVIGGVDSQLNTLQDVPIEILVQAPTPTPVPLGDRLGDSITNNAGAIVVALIGLIGTLAGILIKLRSDQDKSEHKKPGR